jgi:hypothetical protein
MPLTLTNHERNVYLGLLDAWESNPKNDIESFDDWMHAALVSELGHDPRDQAKNDSRISN